MDGNTTVLRGIVEDDTERRTVEGIARLTPGVRDLRNELQVRNPSPPEEEP
jgi:osmotically-inducible protein OsmY